MVNGGVLGQVRCLIVSIPDICFLSYFYLFTFIYYNICTHIDVPARLAHVTHYA